MTVYTPDQWQEAIVALANAGAGGTPADTYQTGTLTAAQPTVGTPVAGGTVTIALGQGQATVEAALTGTFNAGTTVLFEGTEDTGVTTNWFPMFGQDTGASSPPNISSIAGGASKLIRIPSMGYAQVRIRANPFAGGDSVTVRLAASVAGSGGGTGGHVTVDNANANGQNTKTNSQSVVIASDQSSPAQPLTIEQSYQSAIRASHAFKVSTGALTATAGPYMALSLWNPNGSGKTAHVTRITSYYETTANHPYLYLYKETSDPSSGWTSPIALTPTCMDLGSGNTSVLTVNRTGTGNAGSLTGTLLHTQDTGAGVNVEAIAGGTMEEIKVPPNSGLTIYLNAISTTQYGITVSLFEETL